MCKPTKNVSIVDRSSTFRGYFKYESNVLLCVFLYTELHTTSSRCCKQILAKGSFRRPQLSCGKRRRLRKTHASDAAVCGKIEKILISKKNSQLAAAVWMSLKMATWVGPFLWWTFGELNSNLDKQASQPAVYLSKWLWVSFSPTMLVE